MNQASAKGQPLGRKGVETRERLLETGRRMLAEISPFDLTPVMICREAQMTSAAFYAYFPKVGEFLFELVRGMTETVKEADLSYLDNPDDLGDAIERLVAEVHQVYTRHHALLQYRNVLSDSGDEAMMQLRTRASLPRIEKLAALVGMYRGEREKLTRSERLAEAVFVNAGIESLAATAQQHFERGQFVSWPKLRQAQVRAITNIVQA